MIEKLKTVLEALYKSKYTEPTWAEIDQSITDLHSVIAEMEAAEPVAWRVWTGKRPESDDLEYTYSEDGDGEPLYTCPQPKAEPAPCNIAPDGVDGYTFNLNVRSAPTLEEGDIKMTQLPTPLYFIETAADSSISYIPYYTAKQMLQFRVDALTEALNCYSPDDTAQDWADKIQTLRETK